MCLHAFLFYFNVLVQSFFIAILLFSKLPDMNLDILSIDRKYP